MFTVINPLTIDKLVHPLTIDISTISPPCHSFKLAVVRSFAPGHGKGRRNVLREVLGDVFTIGKIAPEHDHLLMFGGKGWTSALILGRTAKIPRNHERDMYNDKDLDWAPSFFWVCLSVWGTCPFYLLRFEAKTWNLMHFGARIFHARFLIKIFYSYHWFLHVHLFANYVHSFLHGNSLSCSMVLIDLYTVFTSCSTVIIDFSMIFIDCSMLFVDFPWCSVVFFQSALGFFEVSLDLWSACFIDVGLKHIFKAWFTVYSPLVYNGLRFS